MSGLHRRAGGALGGWEHTWQSILVILGTRIGTRVMRRDFGSEVPALIDQPGTQARVVDVTMACAEALDRWEPRFQLRRVAIDDAGPDGVFVLTLSGRYFPRGHLGDFSVYEDDREVAVRLAA